MNPIVVDLSHWNPTPDWDKLKAGGTVGVIHKATESTGYVDDMLFARAKPAMDAGLKWSTYHFLRPGALPKQMDHYLNTIDPVQGERVCLDHEDKGVTIGDLEYCVNYIRGKRPDLQICIYSGHVIKEQIGDKPSSTLATTSLWIAHYTTASAPTWPTQVWPTWSLWQYTDKATVQGISKPVDGDKFNGSAEQCAAWFGPAEAIPEPAPEPEPMQPNVDINIVTGGNVDVFITVNGVEIKLP